MSEEEILAILRRLEAKVNWIQGRLNYIFAKEKMEERKKNDKNKQ